MVQMLSDECILNIAKACQPEQEDEIGVVNKLFEDAKVMAKFSGTASATVYASLSLIGASIDVDILISDLGEFIKTCQCWTSSHAKTIYCKHTQHI